MTIATIARPLSERLDLPEHADPSQILSALQDLPLPEALGHVAQAACRDRSLSSNAPAASLAATSPSGVRILVGYPEAFTTMWLVRTVPHDTPLTWGTVVELTHRVAFTAAAVAEGPGRHDDFQGMDTAPDVRTLLRHAPRHMPADPSSPTLAAHRALRQAARDQGVLEVDADLAFALLLHRLYTAGYWGPHVDEEDITAVVTGIGQGGAREFAARFGPNWVDVVRAVRARSVGCPPEPPETPAPRTAVPEAVRVALEDLCECDGRGDDVQGLASVYLHGSPPPA